ncbi:hypothetical protein [Bacillus pseudomycoides]|nr:hypothetical protein [Bacillus pseudomycoides]
MNVKARLGELTISGDEEHPTDGRITLYKSDSCFLGLFNFTYRI